MDCVLSWSEVDLGLPHFLSIYTRDMMNIVLTSSEGDLGLPKNVVIQDLFHSRRGHNPSYT
jgi:hypothetical protein